MDRRNVIGFTLCIAITAACRSHEARRESTSGEEEPSAHGLETRATPANASRVRDGGELEVVARFEHQVTGVAVAQDGRTFVSFPRWTEDAPISVAELRADGTLVPYPDARWNAWRNARADELAPREHWICVQSVFADGRGSLWVLDPAAPATDDLVPGGPKLVRIELRGDRALEPISFDESVAPQGSYLNDVRVSPDGRFAYITDSGARGALVVVDVRARTARRVLDGHPSTQAEKGVVVRTDGRELRRSDGRAPRIAADGIALSPDGEQLYWQALTGRTLHRIDTASLRDPSVSSDELGRRVEDAGVNGVSDGLWIDASGRMYISALEDDAIKVREGERVSVLVRDAALRWPDTFAQGPDGALYVTASRIQDMQWYVPENGPRLATALLRVPRARLDRR